MASNRGIIAEVYGGADQRPPSFVEWYAPDAGFIIIAVTVPPTL